MAGRKSRQVEVRMVAEYLKLTYPDYSFITKLPLGKISEQLQAEVGFKRAAGLTRPFRPEIDAVVIMPGALVLVEAKVWNIVTGLAKLPIYNSLVPFTPELKQYWKLPVIMELVVGWTNPNLEIMAQAMGVRVRVYCPGWLGSVVEDMHKYWTREYQDERQRKLEARERLGLE